jgi:hypothetical protein
MPSVETGSDAAQAVVDVRVGDHVVHSPHRFIVERVVARIIHPDDLPVHSIGSQKLIRAVRPPVVRAEKACRTCVKMECRFSEVLFHVRLQRDQSRQVPSHYCHGMAIRLRA